MPQGSVSGHVLFLVYTNDTDEDVASIISKIANSVVSNEQLMEMQKNLDKSG